MRNYYDVQTKSHLAQTLLVAICGALTKAAKLGKEGMSMLDSLTITLVEATGKRNELMQELESQEMGTKDEIQKSIMKAMEAAQAASKAKMADISTAGDPNEVW